MSTKERYQYFKPISWGQFHKDAKELAQRLIDKGPFKGIVAITRGGLMPAGIVARELEIRLIETMCIVSYDWVEQGETCKVIKGVEGSGEGWLIIDDLVDTGRTAELVRQTLPKAYFATVYAKPSGKTKVDLFIEEFSQDTWVLFPWDAEMQFVPPLGSGRK